MTALSPLTSKPITRSALLELLSSEGLSYENFGAGVREAVECLRDAQEFYAIPAVVNEPLSRFHRHLEQALAALSEASELVRSEADLQHTA